MLQCSQQVQKKYGSCDTNVGQKHRLKIGIGTVPGTDPWHFPVPQGASQWQGMWGSPLGLVPKESISCNRSGDGTPGLLALHVCADAEEA